jgi:hypothetical protein
VNWGTFLRREWGAATFVATVFAGLVVVPIALYLASQSPTPAVVLPTPSAASAARTASPPRTATPTPAVTPTKSP